MKDGFGNVIKIKLKVLRSLMFTLYSCWLTSFNHHKGISNLWWKNPHSRTLFWYCMKQLFKLRFCRPSIQQSWSKKTSRSLIDLFFRNWSPLIITKRKHGNHLINLVLMLRRFWLRDVHIIGAHVRPFHAITSAKQPIQLWVGQRGVWYTSWKCYAK